MSTLIERMYNSPVAQTNMKGKMKIAYVALGVIAFVMLATAYTSQHQLLHMIGTSVGVYGMVLLRVISSYQEDKIKYLKEGAVIRDVVLTVAWTFLLYMWIQYPTVQ